MSAMHLTAEKQTAAALLPMGGQRRQVQHHEGAAGFAVGGRASEGRLQEVCKLTRWLARIRCFKRESTRRQETYLRVAIRHVRLSFTTAQRGDDIAQTGQRLVDRLGFFHAVAFGAGLLQALAACQIDEVEDAFAAFACSRA
jgi:hypothetical protein